MLVPGLPRRTGWQPAQLGRLEPVRSAEPPRNSGSAGASALIAIWLALRVATVSPLALIAASFSATCAFQLAGRSPFMRRSNSAASAGKAFLYSANLLFHSVSRPWPLVLASQPA